MDEHLILNVSVDSDDALAGRDILVLPFALFVVPMFVNNHLPICIEAQSVVDLQLTDFVDLETDSVDTVVSEIKWSLCAVCEGSPLASFVVSIEVWRTKLLSPVTEVYTDPTQGVSLTLLYFDLVQKHVPEQLGILILLFWPLEVATRLCLLGHAEAEHWEFLRVRLPSQESVQLWPVFDEVCPRGVRKHLQQFKDFILSSIVGEHSCRDEEAWQILQWSFVPLFLDLLRYR